MWKDIISHKDEIDILKSYIASGRIPHTILFSGQKGIGKSRIAVEFFKSINCTTSPGEHCDKCTSCIKTDSGNHPDLHFISPKGAEIIIDDIRNMLSELGLKPFEARHRAIIIEPAELLNKSSANILLKSLEEPPPRTIFILISHKPGLLLPTIVSRCQAILFKPINAQDAELDINASILKLSSGHLGGIGGDDADVVDFIRSEIVSVMNGGDPFNSAEAISRKNIDPSLTLSILESFIRDILLVIHGGDAVINEEILQYQGNTCDIDQIVAIILKLNRIRSLHDSSVNMKFALCELLYHFRRVTTKR